MCEGIATILVEQLRHYWQQERTPICQTSLVMCTMWPEINRLILYTVRRPQMIVTDFLNTVCSRYTKTSKCAKYNKTVLLRDPNKRTARGVVTILWFQYPFPTGLERGGGGLPHPHHCIAAMFMGRDVDRQTPVKTLPSSILRNGSGNKSK